VIRWAACDPGGADEQLPAASMIKLFVASAFWCSGRARRRDPAHELAFRVAEIWRKPTLRY